MRVANKQRQIHRVLILLAVFLSWFAAIAGRLVFLQVYQHEEFSLKAQRQQQDTIEVESNRGVIYDRKIHELAVSVDVQSVFANPQEVADAAEAAEQLAPILGVDREALEQKLSSSKAFVWLKRKVDFAVEGKIQQAKLPGIRLIKESKRFFPHQELAGQLLGFVGMDNNGLDGLEMLYDSELKGSPGLYFVQRDAKQKILGSQIRRKPVPGNTLVLNIDKNIQFIVEKELAAAVSQNQAQGGTAVLMNPHTGQILALANYPCFNPNRFESYPPSLHRNRAVTDVYEPGSTFKIVTIGSALDEGLLDPSEQINCQMGSITLANHTVKDHTPMGLLDYSQVIAHSSNVGAIQIGLRMNAERFYRRITAFGVGRKSSIDLPGETPGLLRKPENWSGVSSGYIAMGYEVGVTPIQMLTVLSVAANGGYWVRPQLVQKIISPDGELIRENKVERRQVITPHTAMLLRRALELVVSEGTGKAAMPETYRVAGKTGTAKKQENGGYAASKYIASFVGYAPASDPAFAAIIVIDEPKGHGYYGGEVAAPVFRAIAEKVLRYLEVAPDRQPAIEYLAKVRPKKDVVYADVPENPTAIAVEPGPSDRPSGTPEIVVVSAEEHGLDMPDFRGKTLRAVMDTCADLGLDLTYHGFGIVVDQSPAAGTRLSSNSSCRVWFSRNVTAKGGTKITRAPRLPPGNRTKLETSGGRNPMIPTAIPLKTDGENE